MVKASMKLTPEKFFNLEEFVKRVGLELQAEFIRKGIEAAKLN